MTALQPTSAEGPTTHLSFIQRSFSDILSSASDSPQFLKPIGQFKGKPSIHFSDEEIEELSKPFLYSVVGKFSYGRPSMERIRKSITAIGFKGCFTVGLLNDKHVLIRFTLEEDYVRFWVRKHWTLDGFHMKLLKWSPNFSLESEPAVVPVWVNLPSLPVQFFAKKPLFNIARMVGHPLKADASTVELTRPSMARICIDVDLSKDLVDKVWISYMGSGFWQEVQYEDPPKYCKECAKLGHDCSTPSDTHNGKFQIKKMRQEYRPIAVPKQTQEGLSPQIGKSPNDQQEDKMKSAQASGLSPLEKLLETAPTIPDGDSQGKVQSHNSAVLQEFPSGDLAAEIEVQPKVSQGNISGKSFDNQQAASKDSVPIVDADLVILTSMEEEISEVNQDPIAQLVQQRKDISSDLPEPQQTNLGSQTVFNLQGNGNLTQVPTQNKYAPLQVSEEEEEDPEARYFLANAETIQNIAQVGEIMSSSIPDPAPKENSIKDILQLDDHNEEHIANRVRCQVPPSPPRTRSKNIFPKNPANNRLND